MELISQPAFFCTIPEKVGSSVTTGFQGNSITLIVDKVTSEQLFAHFNLKPSDNRTASDSDISLDLYGQVVFDLTSGWIDRMSYQSNATKHYSSSDYTDTTISTMQRVGLKPNFIDLVDYDKDFYIDNRQLKSISFAGQSSNLPLNVGMFSTTSEVYSNDRFDEHNSFPASYHLYYKYPFKPDFIANKLVLANVVGVDKKGNKIDRKYNIYNQINYPFNSTDSSNYITGAYDLIASGKNLVDWGKPDSVSTFTGTIELYPVSITSQKVELPIEKSKTIKIGDIPV